MPFLNEPLYHVRVCVRTEKVWKHGELGIKLVWIADLTLPMVSTMGTTHSVAAREKKVLQD